MHIEMLIFDQKFKIMYVLLSRGQDSTLIIRIRNRAMQCNDIIDNSVSIVIQFVLVNRLLHHPLLSEELAPSSHKA